MTALTEKWSDLLPGRGQPLAGGILLILAPFCLGVAILAVPPDRVPFVLVLLVLSLLGIHSVVRPAGLLYLVLLISALGGLTRSLGSLPAFHTNVTLAGWIWLMVDLLILLHCVIRLPSVRFPGYVLPFLGFLGWTVLRWLLSPNKGFGAKEILSYSIPVFALVFLQIVFPARSPDAFARLDRFLGRISLLPALLFAFLLLAGKAHWTPQGIQGLLGPRAIALFLLVGLGHCVAGVRYPADSAHPWRLRLTLLAILATIFSTLSRTAGVLGLLMVFFLWVRPDRNRDILKSLLAGGAICLALITGSDFVRSRFLHTEDPTLAGIWRNLDTAGRNNFWPITASRGIEKAFLGWGPGSSRILLGQFFPTEGDPYHPHNEYLQVFHDLGLVGVALVFFGYLNLVRRHRRLWRRFHGSGDLPAAKWNLSAFLSLVAILGSSLTDNTLHYGFVLWPAFTIMAIGNRFAPARGDGKAAEG